MLFAQGALAIDAAPPLPQRPAVVQGHTGSSLSDPVVSADALLRADRSVSWRDGDRHMLLLDRHVTIRIGAYGFQAQRVFVQIDTRTLPGGRSARELSFFLDQAKPLPGLGPVQAQAPRLLVTATTTGQVRLSTDLFDEPDTALLDPFVAAALTRIARHRIAVGTPLLDLPQGAPVISEQVLALRQQRRQQIAQESLLRSVKGHAAAPTATTAQAPSRPIMSASGTLIFHADKIIFQDGQASGDQSVLSLLGNVRVIYQNHNRQQTMSLRAENAVIFLSQDAMARATSRQASAGDVTGVYLEDNVVATDGQYTVRAPRVFYDLVKNKAVVLDAVYYTWDVKHRVPIYVRARKLQQESMTHWSAKNATLTTSEFAEPHFSIASGKLEFRRQTTTAGSPGYRFVAKDSTLRWGPVPVFYWPYLAGNAHTLEDAVLPRVSAGFSDQDGPVIRTTWNLFAVAGQPQPDGVKLRGRADWLGDRGPAVGLNLAYSLPQMFGELDGYVLQGDHGEDELGDGRDLDRDGDTRGYALWRHRQYLRNGWELSLEASHASDETFLEEFFRSEAERSKPYETSAYLKKQEVDRAFTFLIQHHTMAFTPQTTTLQTPGYTVEKTPQLGYYQRGASLWGNRLTYTGETTIARMRINAGEDRLSDRGFVANQSLPLFGIGPETTFESAARARGIPGSFRLRLDSRHEIQSPLKMGDVDLVPFVVGRATLYDDDFEEFSDDDDRFRGWGSVGFRATTHLSKTYPNVQNRVLDLYQLRHVIEPRVDLLWAGSTIDPDHLPVYDADVESLHEGFTGRVGVQQTLQTHRGGTGRWRSVDWLSIATDLVLRSDDAAVDADVARFFSYRPEFSVGGDHFHSEVMWMVSDALAAVGELTYNLEDSVVSHWRLGASLQQSPRLAFFTNYYEIDALSSRLLTYGFNYQLTPKYTIGYTHTLDLGGNDSRDISLTIERRLPRWRLQVIAQVDELEDETTFGMVLIPEGLKSSRGVNLGGRQ